MMTYRLIKTGLALTVMVSLALSQAELGQMQCNTVDLPGSMVQLNSASDGGYYYVTRKVAEDNSKAIATLWKLDDTGAVEKSMEIDLNIHGSIYDIVELPNHVVLAGGVQDKLIVVAKDLNSHSTKDQEANHLIQSLNDGFFVISRTKSEPYFGINVSKWNSAVERLSEEDLLMEDSLRFTFNSGMPTSDGGMILTAGWFKQNFQESGLIRLDASGNFDWQKALSWSPVYAESMQGGGFWGLAQSSGGSNPSSSVLFETSQTGEVTSDKEMEYNISAVQKNASGEMLVMEQRVIDGKARPYFRLLQADYTDKLTPWDLGVNFVLDVGFTGNGEWYAGAVNVDEEGLKDSKLFICQEENPTDLVIQRSIPQKASKKNFTGSLRFGLDRGSFDILGQIPD